MRHFSFSRREAERASKRYGGRSHHSLVADAPPQMDGLAGVVARIGHGGHCADTMRALIAVKIPRVERRSRQHGHQITVLRSNLRTPQPGTENGDLLVPRQRKLFSRGPTNRRSVSRGFCSGWSAAWLAGGPSS